MNIKAIVDEAVKKARTNAIKNAIATRLESVIDTLKAEDKNALEQAYKELVNVTSEVIYFLDTEKGNDK